MSKFSIFDFKGVIPAMLTPFDLSGNLDEEGIREMVNYLLSFDIGGLYLTGSTGETFLMDSDERKKALEIIVDEVKDRVPLVVHIGTISTDKAIDLAKHAEQLGVTGISSVPPFYWKFSEESIYNYYHDIASSVDLPMLIYNLPLAGMMSVNMIAKLAKIPNVKGIKYTGTALYELTQIKDMTSEDFLLYGGADELASSNLSLAVDGIIGSFYNLIPDLFIKINQLIVEGDNKKAQKYQKDGLRLIMDVLKHDSMVGAIKAILRAAGIKAGYARKPFINFTGQNEADIVKSFLAVAEKYQITDLDIIDRLKKKD